MTRDSAEYRLDDLAPLPAGTPGRAALQPERLDTKIRAPHPKTAGSAAAFRAADPAQ